MTSILIGLPFVKTTKDQDNALFDKAHRDMMSRIHVKYPMLKATWEWNHDGSILFYWLNPNGLRGYIYIMKNHKRIIKDLKHHTPIFMNVEYAFPLRILRKNKQ